MVHKKLRRISVSAAGIALALIAVILINLIASTLTDRFDLTIDLTAGRLYEITDETKDMLRSMEHPVEITILASEDDYSTDTYYSKVHTLLQKYQNLAGDQLQVSYIDPYTNPNAVDRYADLASSIQSGSMILSCGDNTRVLNTTDFYAVEENAYYSGYYDVTGFQGEQALTSAILSVVNEATPAAYILQGHGESISTSLSDLFTTAGYTADALQLTGLKQLPEDAAVLVLSLPQTDYSEAEIDLIDGFVRGGGDLMVFDGTACPTELPTLYGYLREWGIDVQKDMVLDAAYNISGEADILAQLTETDANADLLDTDQSMVTPNAKSIVLRDDVPYASEILLDSLDTSYAKVLTDETQYDSYDRAEDDAEGPFHLAVLTAYDGNTDGQIFVCSAGMLMSDDLMGASSLLNRAFLRNVLSQMQPEHEIVSIPSKTLSAEPLVIGTTATFVVFVLLALLPFGMFAVGIVVFLRRRRL